MSDLLDFNIDYIISKEHSITDKYIKLYDRNLNIYGKQDFKSGLYVSVLLHLIKVGFLGNNTRRAIYAKLVETVRKNGVTDLYKIPNTPPPVAVYPYYFGSGDSGLLAADIQLLTEDMAPKADKSYTFTLTEEVYYVAYPISYGILQSILDLNGFETINGWTRTEKTFTINLEQVSYYVYEFNHITSQVAFVNTFKY